MGKLSPLFKCFVAVVYLDGSLCSHNVEQFFEINVSIRSPLPKSPGWSCVFLDMPLPDVMQVQSSNLGTVQCTEYHSMVED